jgi:uncharacterized membrane protein
MNEMFNSNGIAFVLMFIGAAIVIAAGSIVFGFIVYVWPLIKEWLHAITA